MKVRRHIRHEFMLCLFIYEGKFGYSQSSKEATYTDEWLLGKYITNHRQLEIAIRRENIYNRRFMAF